MAKKCKYKLNVIQEKCQTVMLNASRRQYKLYLRWQATLVGGPAAGVADGSACSIQSL